MSIYLDVEGSSTPMCSSGGVRADLDVNGGLPGLGIPVGVGTAAVRYSIGIYWDGITTFIKDLSEWEVLVPFSAVFSGVLIGGIGYMAIHLRLQQDGSLFLTVFGTPAPGFSATQADFQVAGPGTFPLDGIQHSVEAAISFPNYTTITWIVGIDGTTVMSGSEGTLTGVLSHFVGAAGYGTTNPSSDPLTKHAWIDGADAFWSHESISDVATYIENLTHVRVDDSFSLNVLSATAGIPRVTGNSCGAPDLNRGIIGGILPPYTGGLPYFGNAPDDGRGGRKLLSVPRLSYTPYQTLLRSSTLRRRKPDE